MLLLLQMGAVTVSALTAPCEAVFTMQLEQLDGGMGAAPAITKCREAALMTGIVAGRLGKEPPGSVAVLPA